MIEKLECTCIEAYKTRKMRDPNCCACSCEHNDLVDQLAKANERNAELEYILEEVAYRCFISGLNTEKPQEPCGENETATAMNYFQMMLDRHARGVSSSLLEKLRKEQSKC